MNQSYLGIYRVLSEELGEKVPRNLKLRTGGATPVIIIFLFACFAVIALPVVGFSGLSADPVHTVMVVAISLCLLFGLFGFYAYSQMKMVRDWEKITGKVEKAWKESMRTVKVDKWQVRYEYKGESFLKTVTGFPGAEVDSPAILLVNPDKPKSCYLYDSNLLWRPVKGRQD